MKHLAYLFGRQVISALFRKHTEKQHVRSNICLCSREDTWHRLKHLAHLFAHQLRNLRTIELTDSISQLFLDIIVDALLIEVGNLAISFE